MSFGYHPYARLPGVDRESWQIHAWRLSARLQLDGRMIPTGERERTVDQRSFPLGDASLDDPFDAPLAPVPPEFQAAVAGAPRSRSSSSRAIRTHRCTRRVGHQFICFEPMTAPTNALDLGRLADARPARRRLQRGVSDQRRLTPVTDPGHGRRRTPPPRTSGRAGWCRAGRRSAPRRLIASVNWPSHSPASGPTAHRAHQHAPLWDRPKTLRKPGRLGRS